MVTTTINLDEDDLKMLDAIKRLYGHKTTTGAVKTAIRLSMNSIVAQQKIDLRGIDAIAQQKLDLKGPQAKKGFIG